MADFPMAVFAGSFLALWLATKFGARLRARSRTLEEDERQDLGVVLAATLTLLGLIIGFTFSMAVTRYDQRKNYEEEEANAIGTEDARAGLLPPKDAAKVRGLLKSYLDQRILFYETQSARELRPINDTTARLQSDLWLAVEAAAAANPNPVTALVAEGMNDVLNSQGYTQAAWWNRIPAAAWALMGAIAICCSFLSGFTAQRTQAKDKLFFVLALAVSVSFFLIADLDSPRGGVIHVYPQNLASVAQSLAAR